MLSAGKLACHWLLGSFLFCLLFDPDDGDSMFLWMLLDLCQTTRGYTPEDSTLHSHRSWSLKCITFNLSYSCKARHQVSRPFSMIHVFTPTLECLNIRRHLYPVLVTCIPLSLYLICNFYLFEWDTKYVISNRRCCPVHRWKHKSWSFCQPCPNWSYSKQL
jgi:hypothetical protein